MTVHYRVTGHCPKCARLLSLLDQDDPTPPHMNPAGVVCNTTRAPVRVQRRVLPAVESKPAPRAQTSKRGQVARAVRSQPTSKRKAVGKVSKLEARLLKKQASIAAYKRTIKRGRALNGESTSSVRTLSGGIPTLGQR